jgi:hypothetical protein
MPIVTVDASTADTSNPVVLLAPVGPEPAYAVEPRYPVVSILVASPSCICIDDTPLVLTLLNITVTLFAQLGIPVKSIAVPLVDATAVPEVIEPPLTVDELMVAPENVDPVITPLALIDRISAVVAPLLPLASLIVPSGEDGTERVKFWVAVADWPI